MRSKATFRVHSFLSAIALLALGFVHLACNGFTNRSDASNAVQAAVSANLSGDCHFTIFKSTVADSIHSKCVICHGGGGVGGLALSTGLSQDSDYTEDYTALSNFIDTTQTLSSQTVLLRKLTQGSDLSHALKLSIDDPALSAIDAWITSILSDPSCTQTQTDNSDFNS